MRCYSVSAQQSSSNRSSQTNFTIYAIYFVTYLFLAIIAFCGFQLLYNNIDQKVIDKANDKVNDMAIKFFSMQQGMPSSTSFQSKNNCGNSAAITNQDNPKIYENIQSNLKKLTKSYEHKYKDEFKEVKSDIKELKSKYSGLEKICKSKESSNLDIFEEPDFAAASLGGSIIHTEGETYHPDNSFLSKLGIIKANQPSLIIDSSMEPGDCWAFKGSTGVVIIKLIENIFIESISVSHIRSKISPRGDITSAPNEFCAFALKTPNDQKPFELGCYHYSISSTNSVQNFPTIKSMSSYKYVKIKINSNHGLKNYTCIYRVMIHGKPQSKLSKLKLN